MDVVNEKNGFQGHLDRSPGADREKFVFGLKLKLCEKNRDFRFIRGQMSGHPIQDVPSGVIPMRSPREKQKRTRLVVCCGSFPYVPDHHGEVCMRFALTEIIKERQLSSVRRACLSRKKGAW
jgi:hypothetical protein